MATALLARLYDKIFAGILSSAGNTKTTQEGGLLKDYNMKSAKYLKTLQVLVFKIPHVSE